MQKMLQTEIAQLLEEAGQLAQQGKREKAYQSSLKATSLAPNEALAWYLRSQTSASTEEQLMCLSRAYSLDPKLSDAKEDLRIAVQGLLKQEPFLAYVHETDELYQVRSGREMLINIPKNRTFEIPYLKKKAGACPAGVSLAFLVHIRFASGRRGSCPIRSSSSLSGPAAACLCSHRGRTCSVIDRVSSGCDHLAGGHPH